MIFIADFLQGSQANQRLAIFGLDVVVRSDSNSKHFGPLIQRNSLASLLMARLVTLESTLNDIGTEILR
ncbi:MAG: hypothetical protein CBD08_000295 [Cellvibrionales bacterium TMED148]|nr:hypothetical protein [Porticoccaceae bacterium]RPG94051.1 MAG: hypothetical protein CBD08_000295 [Cellvibrionales bacterium TMED148]|tara:strand:+ start:379 stop:585 length:207 start_codon:yes stop_codon:yes gene_type:complete